jgi:putative alpha-1,2-mannosidase
VPAPQSEPTPPPVAAAEQPAQTKDTERVVQIVTPEKPVPAVATEQPVPAAVTDKNAAVQGVLPVPAPQSEPTPPPVAAVEQPAQTKEVLVTVPAPQEPTKPVRVDMKLTDYVNLFVGTTESDTKSGHAGNVNPGAQTPFGMVSFGPDTTGSGEGWGKGSGGYYHDDTNINHFSLTHLNGPGCRGQGAVALLPMDQEGPIDGRRSEFLHPDERATPGYYSVVFNSGIKSELTATARSGMARFTYKDAQKAFLVIDVARNNKFQTGIDRYHRLESERFKRPVAAVAEIAIDIDRQSVSGKAIASEFCEGTWKQPVYFHATFDKKLKPTSQLVKKAAQLQFDLPAGETTVLVKIGISSVSEANARLNLETENKDWSFDALRAKASEDWNDRLNTIQIDMAKTPTDQLTESQRTNLTKFYTAFYRVFSGPTIFSDVNGDYRSMKQTNLQFDRSQLPPRETRNVADYKFKVNGEDVGYTTHYSGFSMWDTYRSQAQMLALIAPDEASEMMQSLVADAEQCGAFPHWVDGSEDTTPMEGDHALNVIAGSYAFGATKFDLMKARKFTMQSVNDPASACNDKPSVGKLNLDNYRKLGYIPFEENGWHASSSTLEMITSDRSAAAFLNRLPTREADSVLIASLIERSKNWNNIFDDKKKALWAKKSTGEWVDDDPDKLRKSNFHESTEPNYIWTIAHDWAAVIEKLGGKAAAITRLNTLFSFKSFASSDEPTGENLNEGERSDRYYIGNEPAFQTPWAYNWAGAPKYAQYIIPVIMNRNFSLGPGGLPGNDDMGATSAWYVWAALGLYPVIPSEPGFAVSTPQFDGMTLWLGNGENLRLETGAQALIDDIRYIKDMKLNGEAYKGSWLPLNKIKDGGKLSYVLDAQPTDWGSGDALTPPSGPAADYGEATGKPPSSVQMVQ